MARVNVSADVVLIAVLARLRDRLSLNERQCFATIYPDPKSIPLGVSETGYFCTVTLGGMNYGEDGLAEGAPVEQLTVTAELTVTTVSRQWLDATDHDEAALLADGRGLLSQHRQILRALVGHDLLTPEGDTFLRGLIRPIGTSLPEAGLLTPAESEAVPVAWMQSRFLLSWDWDLS